MVALPLVHLSTMTPCFYGVPGFFCKICQLWSSLLLSLQAVLSQPTSVPSLGPCSKPHFPAPSSPPQQVTHDSIWSAQSCGVDDACSSYFVMPSTDHPLHSPLIPQSSFSVPADFPTMRKFFCMWGLPLTCSLPPGLLVPFLIPLFFCSSFSHPTWL